jgi:vancomycin resistance protein YoaR
MTTITFPGRLMRPVATRPARRALLIGFAATLLGGALVIAAIAASIGIVAGATVMPGVTAAGVPLGGLSREAAAERLIANLPSLTTGQATIVVGDELAVVEYADVGRGYETAAMVDAAFGIGREGSPIADGIARLRNLAHPATLPVVVHAYDADAIERIASEIAERFSQAAVDASVEASGATFRVTPSRPGLSVDPAAVQASLAAAIDTPDPADVRVVLEPTFVPPAVATADAERVAAAARATVASLVLEVPGATEGEEPHALTSETIASWLSFGPDYGGIAYALHLDEDAVAVAIEALAESVNQDAVDARIGVAAGGGLGGVIAAQDGRELDVEATHQALLAALERRGRGASVPTLALAVTVTEPAFTTAEAQAALPQMVMISSWTTYYVPGEGNGWGNNINIGARDIDGRNLAPGEWFSFWGGIGPVTVERGYQYGGVIIGGRSVKGGAIGGGICSTSTTIFNAALRAGLEMGIRANHYYYINRYPDGLDATVYADDNFVQDMTFRNDTANPIVIRGFGGNGFVTFQLWSIPTGRTVVITDAVTSNHQVAQDTTQVDTSMAPGTSRRVEFPHDGHDVSRSRFVYDAGGNEIHRNTYFSHYATVSGIVLVGPAPAVPEPPPAEPVPPAP